MSGQPGVVVLLVKEHDYSDYESTSLSAAHLIKDRTP